jgi:hypothetical protein
MRLIDTTEIGKDSSIGFHQIRARANGKLLWKKQSTVWLKNWCLSPLSLSHPFML